jgi:formiminoglutamase
MAFLPTSSDYFFKRNEAKDPRWGEKVNSSPESSAWILRGYPDDEGIQLNGGRLGAHKGPDSIRSVFYKTTWQKNSPTLTDLGNLDTLSFNLEQRHEVCRSTLKRLLEDQRKVITLGGGHDYGFPDGAGFLDVYNDQCPVVINFDAHLDVRPLDRGLSSGTPFYRLLNEFKGFDFYQIGIQPQCNSEEYFNWCKDQGGNILTWPQALSKQTPLSLQVVNLLQPSLAKTKNIKPPAFISLDIDVFSNAVAPGCSQSWPSGLEANEFILVLEALKQTLDIKVFGIYEVSPPLDIDSRTSKLAAQWIHQLLSKDL